MLNFPTRMQCIVGWSISCCAHSCISFGLGLLVLFAGDQIIASFNSQSRAFPKQNGAVAAESSTSTKSLPQWTHISPKQSGDMVGRDKGKPGSLGIDLPGKTSKQLIHSHRLLHIAVSWDSLRLSALPQVLRFYTYTQHERTTLRVCGCSRPGG